MSNSGYYQAAATAAGSFLGAGPSYGFNAMGASLAFDRQKKLIKRGPTWAMIGLRNAGLNPILAASGGLKIGGPGSAQMAHAAKNEANAPLAAIQANMLSAQTSAADAAASHSNAQADIVRAGQPRADYLRELYSSQKGRDLALREQINQALPNTAAGIATKLSYGGGRNQEIDSLIGAAANAPGALFRRYQQRQRKNQGSWNFQQKTKAR